MIGTTTPRIHPKHGPMTWWRMLPGTRKMNEIKWLFQLDDGSQIITMEKMFGNHHVPPSITNWLFGVERYIPTCQLVASKNKIQIPTFQFNGSKEWTSGNGKNSATWKRARREIPRCFFFRLMFEFFFVRSWHLSHGFLRIWVSKFKFTQTVPVPFGVRSHFWLGRSLIWIFLDPREFTIRCKKIESFLVSEFVICFASITNRNVQEGDDDDDDDDDDDASNYDDNDLVL